MAIAILLRVEIYIFSTWYDGGGLEKQENVANYRATGRLWSCEH